MNNQVRLKDIMIPINEYGTVHVKSNLGTVLGILKRKYEVVESGGAGVFHKTIFVTDDAKRIIGKVSAYDLIRGLVPEASKEPKICKKFIRAREPAIEASKRQEQLAWLSSVFSDLVAQEACKKIEDIMSPIYPPLNVERSINVAIYIMFSKSIRNLLVEQEGKVVGVINLTSIFHELLKVPVLENAIPLTIMKNEFGKSNTGSQPWLARMRDSLMPYFPNLARGKGV